MRWSTVSTSLGFLAAGQSGCPANVPTGGGAGVAGADCCAVAVSTELARKTHNMTLQLRFMRSAPCFILIKRCATIRSVQTRMGSFKFKKARDDGRARRCYLDQGGTTPLVRA